MAIITDPDQLNQNTEVTINTGTKKITLSVAGNLTSDGVTLKCLYSFLKEEWKADAALIPFPFPMQPITDEQFELINGWDFTNDSSRYLVRTGGWAVKDAGGVSLEEWACVITLGEIGGSSVAGVGTDQVYFQQGSTAAVNFQRTGAVNQAIKIYGDVTHGNFDYRSSLTLFVRAQGKLFDSSTNTEIGRPTLTYQAYSFPLSNSTDLKVTHTDIQIDANTDGTPDVAPYSGMAITWYAVAQQRSIGGVNRDFHVIINGNNGTLEQIYEFVQFQLRKTSGDIDAGAGTKVGNVTNELLGFVGDTLKCKLDSTGGVFIENIQSVDSNRIVFIDDSGTERTNPYTAVLTINFGENLVNDADAKYWVFFTNDDAGDNSGRDYGTATAIIVKDGSNADMTGNITGASSIQKTFAYDTNIQRGAASAGDDAPITVVAIGLGTAQFIKATGTIQRSTANVVSLIASLERNYQNA